MHRCSPCHSGWKSQTAGLAYVQTPVLGLFKYILGGFCVLKAANLLCATTVFWSGRKNGSCQDPNILALWFCPGEPCRWPLSSVRGQTSFPAHPTRALPVHPGAESLMGCRLTLLLLLGGAAAHLNQQAVCTAGCKQDLFPFYLSSWSYTEGSLCSALLCMQVCLKMRSYI